MLSKTASVICFLLCLITSTLAKERQQFQNWELVCDNLETKTNCFARQMLQTTDIKILTEFYFQIGGVNAILMGDVSQENLVFVFPNDKFGPYLTDCSSYPNRICYQKMIHKELIEKIKSSPQFVYLIKLNDGRKFFIELKLEGLKEIIDFLQ